MQMKQQQQHQQQRKIGFDDYFYRYYHYYGGGVSCRKKKLIGEVGIFFFLFSFLLVFYYYNMIEVRLESTPFYIIDGNNNKTEKNASTKTILIKTTQNKCQKNNNNNNDWSQQIQETYEKHCKGWSTIIESYQASEINNELGYSIYSCKADEHCRGLGDRLAGLQGVLSHAIDKKKKFRVYWPSLNSIFKESCIMDGNSNTQWGETIHNNNESECSHQNGLGRTTISCSYIHTVAESKCFNLKQNRVFEDVNRVCEVSEQCNLVRNLNNNNPTALNMVGCSLRSILSPTDYFMRNVKVLFLHNEKMELLSLNEILTIMSSYFVIAVHFRLGDKTAFNGQGVLVKKNSGEIVIPFRCAQTVQSYVETVFRGGSNNNTTKPVRYFIASDSMEVRNLARKMFSKKLLMIGEEPEHIGTSKQINHTDLLHKTFVEWYILGSCNQLIANSLSTHSLFGGLHARLSGFSKTAWIYHLKDSYFDAGTCQYKKLPLDGSWEQIGTTCLSKPSNEFVWSATESNLVENQNLHFQRQEHLNVLRREKKFFPSHWRVSGKTFGGIDK